MMKEMLKQVQHDGKSFMINNPVATALTDAAGLGKLIGNLIAMGIIIASILVLLYLVLGGIEWIASGGDKAGLTQARERITNALIGLAIVVASWALMTIISTFLGLSFPCLPIPTLSGIKSTCAINQQPQDNLCDYSTCLKICKEKGGTDAVCVPYCHAYGASDACKKPSLKPWGATCGNDGECADGVCNYNKCAACSDFSNTDGTKPGSDSGCYSHGQACNWTYTDRGAGKGICSRK